MPLLKEKDLELIGTNNNLYFVNTTNNAYLGGVFGSKPEDYVEVLIYDMNENLLESSIVDKEDYVALDTDQQQLIFQTCKTIMMAIYNSIKYENVFPVIMCGDVEAKHIIGKAIKSVEHILPSTNKITVSLIH